MKYKIFIDKEHTEEIIIYTREKTKLIEDIEQLILNEGFCLIGYKDKTAIPITPTEVCCFIVEENKVFALTKNEKLQIKARLYQLEEKLPKDFVKINQSCLANIDKIERFDASLSGTLTVELKNGYRDYVSRRNVKNIKKRLGL